jgi:hypothetical protein
VLGLPRANLKNFRLPFSNQKNELSYRDYSGEGLSNYFLLASHPQFMDGSMSWEHIKSKIIDPIALKY